MKKEKERSLWDGVIFLIGCIGVGILGFFFIMGIDMIRIIFSPLQSFITARDTVLVIITINIIMFGFYNLARWIGKNIV